MFINSKACKCEHCGKLSNLTNTNPVIKNILDEVNQTNATDERLFQEGKIDTSFDFKRSPLFEKHMEPYIVPLTKETYKEMFIEARRREGLAVETTNAIFEGVMSKYYIATSDLYFIPQYGVKSIRLIIPKGIKVYDIVGGGHSGYYDMDTGVSCDFKFYLFNWMLSTENKSKKKGWF